jgi:hypothetical protein
MSIDNLIFQTVMSDDQKLRFILHRQLKDVTAKHINIVVGCNPSVANAERTDNTHIKVNLRAEHMGATDTLMLNLNPIVSTDVTELNSIMQSMTANELAVMYMQNEAYLELVLRARFRKTIICAWGKEDKFTGMIDHAERFLNLFGDQELYCVAKNKDGSPKHPLLHSTTSPLISYNV